MIARFGRFFMAVTLAAITAGGCKQGLDEVCQANGDCESRICNPVTRTCQQSGTPIQDAAPDAADASIDAPADAAIDAPADAAAVAPVNPS